VSTKAKVKAALREVANPAGAAVKERFYKSGKGEYGEGDKFICVTVPAQRKIAKQFRELSLREVGKLLDDALHECRLTALFIMVDQFRRGDEPQREAIVGVYFEKMDRVNNWDLVDSSADKILGAHLENKDRSLLNELAAADHLWRQRIAIVAAYHFIRQEDFKDTLRISETLLNHEHDLIHKAVGWMLREVGNRNQQTLERFLCPRYNKMPRTMLRYAIERFPEELRKAYLRGEV
jgi:3-methyladenine DNA glycosylase AlkD